MPKRRSSNQTCKSFMDNKVWRSWLFIQPALNPSPSPFEYRRVLIALSKPCRTALGKPASSWGIQQARWLAGNKFQLPVAAQFRHAGHELFRVRMQGVEKKTSRIALLYD